MVIKAASKGDETCINILNSEIDELIEHINAMKEKIGEAILSVSLIGGTITTDNFYAKQFRKKVDEQPGVKIVEAQLPPDMGAALMAKNLSTNN